MPDIIWRKSIYSCYALLTLRSVSTNRIPIGATAPAQINAVHVPTILANQDTPTDPVPKPIIVTDRIVPRFFVPNRSAAIGEKQAWLLPAESTPKWVIT